MGTADRIPTLPELDRMKSLVWRAMADGAVGFSTGLQYVPGTYAADAGDHRARARSPPTPAACTRRTCATRAPRSRPPSPRRFGSAQATGARVQISHLKVDSPSRWGASAKALELIDAARARGRDRSRRISTRTPPRARRSGSAFPSWALEGGPEKIAERLNDPPTWARIKTEMAALLAERGLPDLSFAVVAIVAIGSRR